MASCMQYIRKWIRLEVEAGQFLPVQENDLALVHSKEGENALLL